MRYIPRPHARSETAVGAIRRLFQRVGLLTRVGIAVLAIGAVVSPGTLSAQQRPNAEVAQRAISQLRSPYCPTMLETCTSAAGAALRDSIYDLAEAGMTSEEIIEWMIDRHGEEYRAAPQRSGAGLWAWIIPPAFLLLAAAVVTLWIRDRRASAPQSPAPTSSLSDEDRDKLSAALREWEEMGEEVV